MAHNADGPIAAAETWLLCILAANITGAWPRTDPAYRRRAAEAWVDENRDHPTVRPHARSALTAELSRAEPLHPLWDAVATTFLKRWRDLVIDTWIAEPGTWGWRAAPRLVSPDYEVALAVPDPNAPPGSAAAAAGRLEGLGFLMHHVDGAWLMAEVRGGADAHDWQLELA